MIDSKKQNSYPVFFLKLVIDYYIKHQNIENTLETFNIGKTSLFRWLKNKNDLHDKKKYNKKSKFTEEIMNYILKYVKRNINFDY